MKHLSIVILILLFATVSTLAQESLCVTDPSIGEIQTVSTDTELIYFVAGDTIWFTYLKGFEPAPYVTIRVNGQGVFDLALGESNVYTIPSDGWYSLGFISSDLTVVKVAMACQLYDAFGGIVKDGYENTKNPTYGATNWQYGAAHVAILFIEYNDESDTPSVGLYDYATETYYADFVTVDMVQSLMDTPPLENTLIFAFGSIQVHVLTTGEIQLTMTDGEGKQYAFIMPSLDGIGAYGYVIEPEV